MVRSRWRTHSHTETRFSVLIRRDVVEGLPASVAPGRIRAMPVTGQSASDARSGRRVCWSVAFAAGVLVGNAARLCLSRSENSGWSRLLSSQNERYCTKNRRCEHYESVVHRCLPRLELITQGALLMPQSLYGIDSRCSPRRTIPGQKR
jgi:hypothetical protein